ncbi:MAG: AAA family ATPase [Desulfobacterales bacterium]|nr:AAA family ATPase [Desulfobacterales bacterium]
MQKKQKKGLTLGKFAPFHKGHQLIIETALDEMDEVIVIIYNASDVTNIPLQIRSAWIKTLYPQVKVIEAWEGPMEVGNTREIQKIHEDYIINKLKISGISAFYSSEFYGSHMSKALNCENRQVDPERKIIPVSATQIRNAPFKCRNYIHPIVYKNLITNVVFLGAPSTGKTTLAEKLATEFNTEWMHEYAREYWTKNQINRKLSLEQLLDIAMDHIKLEDEKIQNSNVYLFTDTNAITTFMFSQYYYGKAHKELEKLALSASNRYDINFLCDIDIPYDDTWDRSGDAKRKIFQKQIIADLHARKLPYYLLKGTIEERIQKVKNILRKHKKY